MAFVLIDQEKIPRPDVIEAVIDKKLLSAGILNSRSRNSHGYACPWLFRRYTDA